MVTLADKFRGCLLGAMLGDVAGAVVEAESPGYIAATYASVDDVLSTTTVEEFTGPDWQVGRYTDDTQMMLCVAEWLLEDDARSAARLLAKFSDAYEPRRRYGAGTASILELFPAQKENWRQLATAFFPAGSFGNGSAMRAAPIGLAFRADLKKAAAVAIESSRPTHSHSRAYQGAVVQTVAVAVAAGASRFAAADFLLPIGRCLDHFSGLLQDTSHFATAVGAIERGLERGTTCQEMSTKLGTGTAAHEAVPMALYCFLRHPDSFENVIHEAIFIGGDTDTIACMAGAISGAFLGSQAIPSRWLARVREQANTVPKVTSLADRLYDRFG